MFVDGDWVDSSSKKTFDVLNPATERVIASVPEGTLHDAKAAVDAARTAFDKGSWSRIAPAERA
jgi:acyl-CoA reductase-like NAD-dependent aldehyde dehydrogenase